MTFVSQTRKVLDCIIEYAYANVSKSKSNGNNSDFAISLFWEYLRKNKNIFIIPFYNSNPSNQTH